MKLINIKKIFTNKKRNNIMRRKYNPLKAKKSEREGLPMKEKDEVVNELNWRERIIVKLFPKTFIKIYKLGITFGFNNK